MPALDLRGVDSRDHAVTLGITGGLRVGTSVARTEIMMTNKIAILLFSALTLTAGCAGSHAAMRGSVVMKMSEEQAHVCLGDGEVAVGDHVRLYNNQCTPNGSKRVTCEKVYVAEGTVTEVLNSHYSVVSFPAGTQFAEGETVEKAQ